jgi:hypothetical protein
MTDNRIPPTLAQEGAERIAFGTTQREGIMGGRTRWTEVAVYYLHNPGPGGKRWVGETVGRSSIPGEHDRSDRLRAGTLERALKLVDTSGPVGVIVAETAREWAEDNRVTIENDRGGALSFPDDAAALAWLYGQPDDGHSGFATMLARDTGMGESTVRMQLRTKPQSVKVPLRALLPFIDRAAFRRAREAARG